MAERSTGLFEGFRARFYFPILLVLALLIAWVPVLSNFLSWQMTFFHEISHGLAALLTGGRILGIELHFAGSGLCQVSGGLRWLVYLSGYLGATFWGLLVYFSADAIPKKYRYCLACFLVFILTVSSVLYARDFQSLIILLAISIWYSAAIKFRDKLPLNFFLKLSGLYIILDAVRAPTYLFGHPGPNDAVGLAAQTGWPAFFWISLWLLAALGGLIFIWKVEKRSPGIPGRAIDRSDFPLCG